MPQIDVSNVSQSGLEQRLRSNRFVLTAELSPPISCDANDLLRKAMPLAGLADGVNVTDGAGARTLSDRRRILRRNRPPDPMPFGSSLRIANPDHDQAEEKRARSARRAPDVADVHVPPNVRRAETARKAR